MSYLIYWAQLPYYPGNDVGLATAVTAWVFAAIAFLFQCFGFRKSTQETSTEGYTSLIDAEVPYL